MPRQERQQSATGIYHVMLKGINKQDIFEEGYCQAERYVYDASQDEFTFCYYDRDHLGNIRQVTEADGSSVGSVIQTMNYYPFGAEFCDGTANGSVLPYKYNGKELDMMHGLNTYDYGARQYFSILGRWDRIDPLCEKYYSLSPYNYCLGNPVKFVDIDGKQIFIDENSRDLILELINTLSKDQYSIDDNGYLCYVNTTLDAAHSQYYSDRLNAAISSDYIIYVSIGSSLKGHDLSLIGEGGTWCNPNGNAEVMITGKTCYSLTDVDGGDLYDGPEYILAHELVGHAIPWTTPSIYNDNRDTGYAIDSENIVRKETHTKERALTNYSIFDSSFTSSQGYDIPWKRKNPLGGFMQNRIFNSLMENNLKRIIKILQ